MSAAAVPPPAARYVLAPVVDGVAAWHLGTDLVLAPLRLSAPVALVLPAPRPVVSDR